MIGLAWYWMACCQTQNTISRLVLNYSLQYSDEAWAMPECMFLVLAMMRKTQSKVFRHHYRWTILVHTLLATDFGWTIQSMIHQYVLLWYEKSLPDHFPTWSSKWGLFDISVVCLYPLSERSLYRPSIRGRYENHSYLISDMKMQSWIFFHWINKIHIYEYGVVIAICVFFLQSLRTGSVPNFNLPDVVKACLENTCLHHQLAGCHIPPSPFNSMQSPWWYGCMQCGWTYQEILKYHIICLPLLLNSWQIDVVFHSCSSSSFGLCWSV